MDGMLDTFADFLTPDRLFALLRAFLLVVVGLVLARAVSATATRMTRGRLSEQGTMLLRRTVYYGLVGLVLASALHQLGFRVTVLVGAAGVLTVALGFASQTAASNLISGLFVIAERPFAVGDTIRLEDITGEVLSVDLLSVKLRTYDNLYVRVPNEQIIKSRITTLTRFPIRRIDMQIGVSYREDLDRVRRVLLDVADRNPLCLDEPNPMFLFQRFGDNAQEFQFSVWGDRTRFVELRNEMAMDIKRAFDAAGIEIPFPQRTLHVGRGASVSLDAGRAPGTGD